MENIFVQAFILFAAGLLCAKIVGKFKLPSVTGYLIGGLLIGPYVFGLVSLHSIESLEAFSSIALGFIAFSIGNEFKISYFKQVGVSPIVIACLEAFAAVVLVSIVMYLITGDLPLSIMIGAIASATAPAATIMVIKQYKAKGPVTQNLLSVVAMDDAAALICFGFALAITNNLTSGGEGNILMMLLNPFVEIGISLLLGGAIGLALSYLVRFFKSDSDVKTLVFAVVLIAIGTSEILEASPLLVCMTLGAVFSNLYSKADKVMGITEEITPPIFVLFFVLSGAELNPAVIPTIKIIGVAYILTRVAGKYLGAYLGAAITKADKSVKKYLGFCLAPQAGVAIGLSLIAQQAVPSHGATIRAVILCATLIYELVGPFITKTALEKAGEITV